MISGRQAQESLSCGSDTVLDVSTNACVCDSTTPEDPHVINIAGIMDVGGYEWASDVFKVAVDLINQGWWDAKLPSQALTYDLVDTQGNETTSIHEYWKLREENNGHPPHGIIGARRSEVSEMLAQVAGLEFVPMLSPASNSADLSTIPNFSRMVRASDENGEVGALVAMLRHFGWERVSVLSTETGFAENFEVEFSNLWKGPHEDVSGKWLGSIPSPHTIQLDENGEVDKDSLERAFAGVLTADSRIILLAAHNHHAFPILKAAAQSNFQSDTVWVGPSTWVGRSLADFDFGWLPEIPGYLGIAPFSDCTTITRCGKFLEHLQDYQRTNNKEVFTQLPPFAAETVDAIIAMTKAISANAPFFYDGPKIVKELRQIQFEGLSGHVEFTDGGERKNPQYSVLNVKSNATSDIVFENIGPTNVAIGSTNVTIQDVCFPVVGCFLDKAVSDRDPLPKFKQESVSMSIWIPIWLGIITFLVTLLSLVLWWRKRRIMLKLRAIRNSMVGTRVAKYDCIPYTEVDTNEGDVEQARELPAHAEESIQWCWQESDHAMEKHDVSEIFDEPECWIKYNESNNDVLEKAYQDELLECSPLPGYFVNFQEWFQMNQTTGHQRRVQRVILQSQGSREHESGIDVSEVEKGSVLPSDLEGEPQMVLVKGDVIQISKYWKDWAFGTKLFHEDETKARKLAFEAHRSNHRLVDEDPNIFTDSGWFPLITTRPSTDKDLLPLQSTIEPNSLAAPSHWKNTSKTSLAQKFEIKKGESQYNLVVNDFLSTLWNPDSGHYVKIIKVERCQNLHQWQSYVVKRSAICNRELRDGANEDEKRKMLERVERCRLWHGCSHDVVDKILHQGFNRSFCFNGSNPNAYGKGVYFARDASYSADPLYAVPHPVTCYQNVIANRVVVGEYCRGRHDALTPDVRSPESELLYDTTVGLLGDDTMDDPSIYVTFHDSQAIPEVIERPLPR